MIAAAIELGLPPDQARLLAAKTAVGAARMLKESPTPRRTSPQGTSPGGRPKQPSNTSMPPLACRNCRRP